MEQIRKIEAANKAGRTSWQSVSAHRRVWGLTQQILVIISNWAPSHWQHKNDGGCRPGGREEIAADGMLLWRW